MISVKEAEDIILSHLFKSEVELIPLELASGRILYSDIQADTDLPPFDRVMMDGIAIRFADWENGQRCFPIGGIQPAGEEARILQPASTLEVMTGALCPKGADCIIPYEEIVLSEEAIIHSENVKIGQHIHFKGSDKRAGDVLAKAGTRLGAAQLMIAASAGHARIGVCSHPRIHIFSTGNELVEIDQVPASYQIRRSNVYGLKYLLEKEGLMSTDSHVMDDKNAIQSALEKALQENDVILLSGGVSKGKFDFIPEMLNELGIKKRFHGITQKPGKPFWFGQGKGKLVFAFPGNPVSTMMCATRYLIPWIRKSYQQNLNTIQAEITSDAEIKGKFAFFMQVKTFQSENGMIKADPIIGSGSGDYTSLAQANGFAEIPSENRIVNAGEILTVYVFA